jgi:hypothetical protein
MVFAANAAFQDRIIDFIRLPIPAGTITIELLDKNNNVLKTFVDSEFEILTGALKLDFLVPIQSQNIKECFLQIYVNSSLIVKSDIFAIWSNYDLVKQKTELLRYAFNQYPNDYAEIRLPINLTKAKPKDNGSKFLTSDDELVRPIPKSQTEYDVLVFFQDYERFQRKIFNLFRQRYCRIQFFGEYYRQVVFEDEFELEYLPRHRNTVANLVAKIKINGTQLESQDNIQDFVILAQPYANAEVYFLGQSANVAFTTRSYRILLDKPLLESQTVSFQVVGLPPSPAQDFYFSDDVFPSGNITFNAYQMSADFSIVIKTDYNTIVEDANYKIQYTDSDLIKFNLPDSEAIIQITGNLNFGDVAIGLCKKLSFQITNLGLENLIVTSLDLPFGTLIYEADWQGGVIAPNQIVTIEITFEPTQTIDYNGAITVYSNASIGNNTIQLTGSGKLFDAVKYTEVAIALVADTAKTINHNLNKETVLIEVWDITSNPDEKVDSITTIKTDNNSLQLISEINRTVNIIVIA